MKRRICIIAGPFDVTQSVSNGLAAWSRMHEAWRIEVLSHTDGQSMSWLATAGYAGIVAIGASLALQRQLADLRRPCICVQSDVGDLPTVLIDDRAIGEMAARHLLDCGYRRFAFYGTGFPWNQTRHEAFSSMLAAKSATCITNQTPGGWPSWDMAQNPKRVRQFLKGLPRPTGVMACNDLIARVLADSCDELKIRIPDDVAIVGVDNSESLCESDQMTLSSVDTDLSRVGEEAGRLLDLAIHHRRMPSTVTYVPPHSVLQRRSTNPAAFDDADVASAIRYIRENACDGITVDDVCNHVSMSRRQLERRFLKHAGDLPGAQIRRLRLTRARDLLRETNLSLTEIALRCGYEHLSSFSAAFHDSAGLSPTAFRRAPAR